MPGNLKREFVMVKNLRNDTAVRLLVYGGFGLFLSLLTQVFTLPGLPYAVGMTTQVWLPAQAAGAALATLCGFAGGCLMLMHHVPERDYLARSLSVVQMLCFALACTGLVLSYWWLGRPSHYYFTNASEFFILLCPVFTACSWSLALIAFYDSSWVLWELGWRPQKVVY
jgi:hypothetical protein